MAFDEKVHKPGGESYLFVLEDTEKNQVVGCSGIDSKVGGFKPFYTYKIKTEHHSDAELNVNKDIQVLHLMENYDGPSEICSLYVEPKYRKAHNGRLLSLSRFLFMAEFTHRFEKNVISEIRGVSEPNGKSPFWEGVGQHFFETDFSYADFLSGLGHKDFIKNLMPQYPIYIPMLPRAIQKVIGKPHKNSEPALHLLSVEGFKFNDEVDIFDAGPTVLAALENIRTIDACVETTLSETKTTSIESGEYIVCNTSLDFKACIAKVDKKQDGSICLEDDVAKQLNLNLGDNLRFVTLK